MNILFIVDGTLAPNNGGIERVTLLLAQELHKRRHEIHIMSTRQPPEESEIDGIKTFFLSPDSSEYIKEFKGFLDCKKIDCVILQGVFKRLMYTLDLIPSDIRKVMVLHNKPFYLYGYERKIMGMTPWKDLDLNHKLLKITALVMPHLHRKLITKRTGDIYCDIARKTDRFMFLSKRYADAVSSLLPAIEKSKLAAIPNPNTFDVKALGANLSKENLVLFVGRLSHPQKNLFDFIKIWRSFSLLNPEWKAIVVGDGEHANIIKKYTRKHKIHNLDFVGNQKDVGAYYTKAKMLCMTSTYEGWPMVLAEAMAYECIPVVFNSFEAVNDIVRDGENGFVIRPFKNQEMMHKMDSLAKDEKKRSILAKVARESISNFGVEGIVDQWESLLSSL